MSGSMVGLTLILAVASIACSAWAVGNLAGQKWAVWWNILKHSQPNPTARPDVPPCSVQTLLQEKLRPRPTSMINMKLLS